jgi:hypothetical protein
MKKPIANRQTSSPINAKYDQEIQMGMSQKEANARIGRLLSQGSPFAQIGGDLKPEPNNQVPESEHPKPKPRKTSAKN